MMNFCHILFTHESFVFPYYVKPMGLNFSHPQMVVYKLLFHVPHLIIFNIFICRDLPAPSNVIATALTHDSVNVEVTSDKLSNVTSYIISYTTTAASYNSNASVRVENGDITCCTLSSLKENTLHYHCTSYC